MNWRRAIWMGVLIYLISFLIGITAAIITGTDLEEISSGPDIIWYIGIVSAVILVILFTLWYFKGKNVQPGIKEGFLLGVVFIIIGTIIDMALIIPVILLSKSPSDILAYYSNPLFWLTLVILLITSTIVGAIKGKKKSANQMTETKIQP